MQRAPAELLGEDLPLLAILRSRTGASASSFCCSASISAPNRCCSSTSAWRSDSRASTRCGARGRAGPTRRPPPGAADPRARRRASARPPRLATPSPRDASPPACAGLTALDLISLRTSASSCWRSWASKAIVDLRHLGNIDLDEHRRVLPVAVDRPWPKAVTTTVRSGVATLRMHSTMVMCGSAWRSVMSLACSVPSRAQRPRARLWPTRSTLHSRPRRWRSTPPRPRS